MNWGLKFHCVTITQVLYYRTAHIQKGIIFSEGVFLYVHWHILLADTKTTERMQLTKELVYEQTQFCLFVCLLLRMIPPHCDRVTTMRGCDLVLSFQQGATQTRFRYRELKPRSNFGIGMGAIIFSETETFFFKIFHISHFLQEQKFLKS